MSLTDLSMKWCLISSDGHRSTGDLIDFFFVSIVVEFPRVLDLLIF